MKTSLADLMARLPGPRTEVWPDGEPFAAGMSRGSMLLEVFAPRGLDLQTPHTQDELYIVATGVAQFDLAGDVTTVKAGDALFVAAGAEHRFSEMSDDFVTWVIFWGPEGGEAPRDGS